MSNSGDERNATQGEGVGPYQVSHRLLARCSSAHWCPEAWIMDSALDIHRLHFAFTITFHYLFPQLTMGLALLIVVLKSLAL
jgi:Cytochrome bd terminal oxidase subunit I